MLVVLMFVNDYLEMKHQSCVGPGCSRQGRPFGLYTIYLNLFWVTPEDLIYIPEVNEFLYTLNAKILEIDTSCIVKNLCCIPPVI